MSDDDFLYRLRSGPSPAFAARLKARLDQQKLGRPIHSRLTVLGLVLAGVAAAVAVPAVRHWANIILMQSVTRETSPAHPQTLTPPSAATTRPEGGVPLAAAGANGATNAVLPDPRTGATSSGLTNAARTESPSGQSNAAPGGVGTTAINLTAVIPESLATLYTRWGKAYQAHTGIELSFQTVDEDIPKLPQQNRASFVVTNDTVTRANMGNLGGVAVFPVVAEGVVPIVHLDGVNTADMVLDGATLAGIYLGEITVWNDPRIVRLNPSVRLPATPTVPIYRIGEAGSNYVVSRYLAEGNQNFRLQIGVGSTIGLVGVGKTDDKQIAEAVDQRDGAIGYVDYAFAQQRHLPSARLVTPLGSIVSCSPAGLQAGALAIWSSWSRESISPDPSAWPMAATSIVVILPGGPRPGDTAPEWLQAQKFFNWIFTQGTDIATELNYVPLPDALVQRIRGNSLRPFR